MNQIRRVGFDPTERAQHYRHDGEVAPFGRSSLARPSSEAFYRRSGPGMIVDELRRHRRHLLPCASNWGWRCTSGASLRCAGLPPAMARRRAVTHPATRPPPTTNIRPTAAWHLDG